VMNIGLSEENVVEISCWGLLESNDVSADRAKACPINPRSDWDCNAVRERSSRACRRLSYVHNVLFIIA
jgi:hypothetical protein